MPDATIACGAARLRIGTPTPNGTVLATDTRRSESFFVYQPLTDRQCRGGHESGLWYFRPVGNESPGPVSLPYPSSRDAIAGLIRTQETKDLLDGHRN